MVVSGDCVDLMWNDPYATSSDVNRGSKNRNSLQFRVLEIEFLNLKLDFTVCISA